MKNLTWQNPEQLFVAQELINKVKSKCCGIKDDVKYPFLHFLFNLWRNARFCLRIYDKMQMLRSNIISTRKLPEVHDDICQFAKKRNRCV